MQDPEELFPRADFGVVLLRHHATDLREMVQVVHDPRREQLPHGDAPESWVPSGHFHLSRTELEAVEGAQVLGAQRLECLQQLLERGLSRLVESAFPVEGRERRALVTGENDAGARYPVGVLAVNEMRDDVVRAPRVGTFVRLRPVRRQAIEQRAKRDGRPFQDFARV